MNENWNIHDFIYNTAIVSMADFIHRTLDMPVGRDMTWMLPNG